MRLLAMAMAVLFAICIALQYNDPDPQVWMSIYALPLVLSVLAARGRQLAWLSALAAAGYVLAALWWAPRYSPGYLDNEEAREAGGLLLSGLWMGFLAWRGKRGSAGRP
jgi:hypothetical protein